MSTLPPRKPTPLELERAVRQQAGFGCCKCGNAVFQYHHIVERSEKPEEIMTLCPNCHDEATKGAMTKEDQWKYKSQPFNIVNGYAQGQLKVNHDIPVIHVGTMQLVHNGDIIIVDGEALLSLYVDNGRLELSAKLYDPNGQLLAEIDRNVWKSDDPFPWDIESSYQWLKIRHKSRAISLDLDLRKFPITLRAELWRNGQNFSLDPSQIKFDGVVKDFRMIHLCLVGLRFEVNSKSDALTLGPDPRFGQGLIISEADLETRIQKGIDGWKQLEKKASAS